MRFLCVLLLAVPTMSLTLPASSRYECPTEEEVREWIEEQTGGQFSDIVDECLSGGDECPPVDEFIATLASVGIEIPDEFWDMVDYCMGEPSTRRLNRSSCPVDEIRDWYEQTTGMKVPDSVNECLDNGNGCPSIQEVKDYVEETFGIQLPDSLQEARIVIEKALGREIPDDVAAVAQSCLAALESAGR